MINPDVVGITEGQGIAAPHVLGVQVGDLEVLDDDVGDRGQAETLACERS